MKILWRRGSSMAQYRIPMSRHRRTRGKVAPLPAPAIKAAPRSASKETPKEVMATTAVAAATSKARESIKASDTTTKPAADPASAPPSRRSSAGKAVPPKREKSDIFKSFAKGKAKPKRQDTESSVETSSAPEPVHTAPPEDEPMKGLSDDEGEDFVMVDSEENKAPTGKTKKQREEELRKMMEEEDEQTQDAESNPIDAPAKSDPDQSTPTQPNDEAAETVAVVNGRRRGRRRVMKKKTMRDDEGYLVTKGEPAWESFSEDEPAPKKVKTVTAPTTAKGKKGGKAGRGDIMSFFSKK
ncbi:hypothetical protein LTR50_006473 [Elasticomyces elasticus]|nr:hypothetical protein LTR50_006473 [Elasticomyces elasticus]